jgi:nicotinamide-nucleotide amidase
MSTAEILAIGTELVIGETVNTNAPWLSRQLAALGLPVHHHQAVDDDPGRIQTLLGQALSRATVLLVTGGLGPTVDDLTLETLAGFFGVPLVSDPDSEAVIRRFFAERQTLMPESNLKQALKPQGAETLPNPVGTAPGICWDVSQLTGRPNAIVTFPGVPRELYAMWPAAAVWIADFLRRHQISLPARQVQSLFFSGLGESALMARFADVPEIQTALSPGANPSLAPYVGRAEIKLRLCAQAEDASDAQALLAPLREALLARAGTYCYAEQAGDLGTAPGLEAAVGNALLAQGLRIAVAESCTGGLLSSRLTDVSGSSAYVGLNVVTYANEAKARLLGVPESLFVTHGAVSAPVAQAMAEGVRALNDDDLGLAVTGIAGPSGGSPEKPVGLVYLALARRGQPTLVRRHLGNPRYDRADLKHFFSQQALLLLWQHLAGLLSDEPPQASP